MNVVCVCVILFEREEEDADMKKDAITETIEQFKTEGVSLHNIMTGPENNSTESDYDSDESLDSMGFPHCYI